MSKGSVTDHERLFDEICGKLNELSNKSQNETGAPPSELNKIHHQLKRSQEELRHARNELNEKIKSIGTLSYAQQDMHVEIKKISDQLEQERMASSKISTDLAKSLELNLKLQFEIEEIRTRANLLVSEERKHNQFLIDKNKTLSSELELSQAVQHEARSELQKAKEKFLAEQTNWFNLRAEFEEKAKERTQQVDSLEVQVEELKLSVKQKEEDSVQFAETLRDFEQHSIQQNQLMKHLSEAAEQKMIELKVNYDRKSVECQDYYGHLQQALTQNQVLRQENAALKDYIAKLSALHQARAQAADSGTRMPEPQV